MGKKSKKVAASNEQLLDNAAEPTKQKHVKHQKQEEEKPQKQQKHKEHKQVDNPDTIQKANSTLKHTHSVKSGRQTIYTWQEVSKHDRKDDAWLVIDDHVYNVTSIIARHVSHIFLERAGKDATRAYLKNEAQFGEDLQKARIGTIDRNSEMEVWQKESGMSSGRSDAIAAALLGLMIFSFMGYLIAA